MSMNVVEASGLGKRYGGTWAFASATTRRFDERYAQARLAELGIPLKRKAGRLSGGQQAVARLAP
jgi:hypothetical protein